MAREIVTSENKKEYDAKKLGLKKEKDEIKEGKSLVAEKGIKYQTPEGYIDIKHTGTEHAPRKQSVVDFVIDEKHRGKGIGKKLLRHAMNKHDDLGAQVSSPASLKVFYSHGFRHPEMPKGTFEEHEKRLKEDTSVFVAHKDLKGKPYV
jgi:GNAT superfamily N-acetyltransferase